MYIGYIPNIGIQFTYLPKYLTYSLYVYTSILLTNRFKHFVFKIISINISIINFSKSIKHKLIITIYLKLKFNINISINYRSSEQDVTNATFNLWLYGH